jgi:hypothetical protein
MSWLDCHLCTWLNGIDEDAAATYMAEDALWHDVMAITMMVTLTRQERLEALYRDMINRLWDLSALIWEVEQAVLNNGNDADSIDSDDGGGMRPWDTFW